MLGTKDSIFHAHVPLHKKRVGKCLCPSLQYWYNAMDTRYLQLCILLGTFRIPSWLLAFPSSVHPCSSSTWCSQNGSDSYFLYMWMYERSVPLGAEKSTTSWYTSTWNSKRIWIWTCIMRKLFLRGDQLVILRPTGKHIWSLFLYSNNNLCTKWMGHD